MKKILLFSCFVFVFLLFSFPVLGQTETAYPSLPGIDSPQETIKRIDSEAEVFPLFMGYIFKLLLLASFFVVLGITFYSIFLYSFSLGDPIKVKNAREWSLSAAHGALIILSSYALLLALDSRTVIFQVRDLEDLEGMEEVDLTWERKNIFFQIPFGLLIEDAALNEKAESKLYDSLTLTEETSELAEKIYQENTELLSVVKKYTQNCPERMACMVKENSHENSLSSSANFNYSTYTNESNPSSRKKSFPSSLFSFFSLNEVFGVNEWSRGGLPVEEDKDSYYEKKDASEEEVSPPSKKPLERQVDEVEVGSVDSCVQCPDNSVIIARSEEIEKSVNTLHAKLEKLRKAKEPMEEDLYQLFKGVLIKSLGSEDLLSYNDFLLKRSLHTQEEIMITTSGEKKEIGSYSWDWERWLHNTVYEVNINGKTAKENDPLIFYLEEPLASRVVKDAENLAMEAKMDGIQDAGSRIALPRHLPPPPPDTGTVLYPPVSPAETRITSPFGWRRDPFSGGRVIHRGLDVAGPRNTPLFAGEDGKVVFAGWAGTQTTGYGKLVAIYHEATENNNLDEDVVTYYAHLEPGSLQVKRGDTVERGRYIAGMGTTGRSTGYHVHYEIRKNVSYPFKMHTGNQINPAPYIDINRWSFSSPGTFSLFSLLSENFSLFENFYTQEVSAKTNKELLEDYLLDHDLDPRYLSEEEFYDIFESLGIEIEPTHFSEMPHLDIKPPSQRLKCGMEIPVGEAFELSWRHLVNLLDKIDYYIDEGERLIKQQNLMIELSSSCRCFCEENSANDCFGFCRLDCPLTEIEEAHKKIKETKEVMFETKEDISLLTEGYFNTPTENICTSLNKDIQNEEEKLFCEEENKLISLHELISRKLNHSRHMFNKCIVRPEYLEDTIERQDPGQKLFFGPLAEEKGLPRYTKTQKSDIIISTNYLNWFCCSEKETNENGY